MLDKTIKFLLGKQDLAGYNSRLNYNVFYNTILINDNSNCSVHYHLPNPARQLPGDKEFWLNSFLSSIFLSYTHAQLPLKWYRCFWKWDQRNNILLYSPGTKCFHMKLMYIQSCRYWGSSTNIWHSAKLFWIYVSLFESMSVQTNLWLLLHMLKTGLILIQEK